MVVAVKMTISLFLLSLFLSEPQFEQGPMELKKKTRFYKSNF